MSLDRAIEIDNIIEKLEYEIEIALLNERFQDAEDAKIEIAELERFNSSTNIVADAGDVRRRFITSLLLIFRA